MDKELMNMFAGLSASHDKRERGERETAQRDADLNRRAQIAEGLAQDMPGFNAERDEWLGPINGHQGEARAFIHGFAGMAIGFSNPRADGPAAVAAFHAGAARRRAMGV